MQPQGPIQTAQRISVVGSTGSGKTFLARELSQRLALPHHELDHLRCADGQSSGGRPDPEFIAAVARLVERPSWVIDGHYRDVRHLVWARSDLVIHLNYPLALVVWRLLSRFLGKRLGPRSRGLRVAKGPQSTSSRASWPRRIARLVKTVRERREYATIFAGHEYRNLPVVELTSPDATRRWLEQLDDRTCEDPSVRIA